MHERAQKKTEQALPAKRSPAHHVHNNAVAETTSQDWENLISAARDALTVRDAGKSIAIAPSKFQLPLTLLHVAAMPSTPQKPQNFVTRACSFDYAMSVLTPALATYKAMDDAKVHETSRHEYVAEYIDAYTGPLKASLHDGALRESTAARVDRAVLGVDDKVIEVPEDPHSREAATLQREAILKVVSAIKLSLEFAKHLKAKGRIPEGATLPGRDHTIEEEETLQTHAMGGLMLISGLLELTDEEFMHRLSEANTLCSRVENYSEFVGAVSNVVGGGISSAASLGAAIAKVSGNELAVSLFTKVAVGSTEVLGTVASLAEALHGLVMLLDPSSTTEQRVDGAAEFAGGGSLAFGSIAGEFAVEGSALEVAAGAVPIVGVAIVLVYEVIKQVREIPSARLAIVEAWMSRSFIRIQEEALSIASSVERLAKAYTLVSREHDPRRSAALLALIVTAVEDVRLRVDAFLDLCESTKYSDESAVEHPGAYRILIEYFRPLARHRGAKTCQQAVTAAVATLNRIRWALENAHALEVGGSRNESMAEVEQDIAEQQADDREKEQQKRDRDAEEEKHGPLEEPGAEWAAA